MLESVPFALIKPIYDGGKNIFRRLFPRTPVEVITVLRGHVEYGHDVLLINTSDEPINVYSVDIVDAAKKGDEDDNCETVFTLEDRILNLRLDKKESHMFHFNESDYFPMEAKRNYFMRVWLAGEKKPYWISL
jgi:hypothetical protein